MKEQVAKESMDGLLLLFLNTFNKEDSERLLSQLMMEHASKIIKSVIQRELHIAINSKEYLINNKMSDSLEDAEDIYGNVIERLLRRLNSIKNSSEKITIDNFSSYIAITSQNACYDYLREKYPHRWRLKNRIRYILNHHDHFACWQNDKEELLTGLKTCKGVNNSLSRNRVQTIILTLTSNHKNLPLVDILDAIFELSKLPIKLDDLNLMIAELSEINDKNYSLSLDRSFKRSSEQYLHHLWTEICQLPLRQRVALLLNLQDANGYGLTLFCYSGIADLPQIAKVLEISTEKLAILWNDLPWQDNSIAEYLNITRQQVINLRKAARERLTFRMKNFQHTN